MPLQSSVELSLSIAGLANNLQNKSYDVSVFTLNQKHYYGTHIINDIEVNFGCGLNLRKKPNTNVFFHFLEKVRVWIDLITPMLTVWSIKKFSPNFLIIHEIDRYGPWLLIFSRLFFNKSQLIRIHHDLSDTCILRSRFLFGKNCMKPCTLCIPKSKLYSLLSKLVYKNIG